MTNSETVIIFVVFAAITAAALYVLVGGSLFSAEKGQNVVHAGVKQASKNIDVAGSVVALCPDTTKAGSIHFTIKNGAVRNPVNMTPCSGTASASNTTFISLITETDDLNNIKWRAEAVGAADSDSLLEAGEQFEVTIDLSDLGDGKDLAAPLMATSPFTIRVKPSVGSVLTVQRTLPATLDGVVDLQ